MALVVSVDTCGGFSPFIHLFLHFRYNVWAMQRMISIGLLVALILSYSPLVVVAEEDFLFNPNYLVSDREMTDTLSMTLDDLQRFLTRGSLASLVTQDVNDIQRTAAEIIYNAALEFELSPKFLLVLLQREQSLIEHPSPSQDQLDWAMGYAVCDDCSKSDPRIQKFKGFGKQVYWAAERIRTNYLDDLETRGYTQTGMGPGIEKTIDNTIVVPVNFATASLYTYTPHLHGNENFARIWEKWFVHEYLSGTLLQDADSGGIWLIQHGVRRPITSRTAFYSRFNPDALIHVSSSELDRYPVGASISFPNYSLLRAPTGTVFLIVDDTRRGFTSQEAFRQIGFSPDEIIPVSWEDLEAYAEGEPISTDSVYPQGTLLQNNTTGGVFYVENGLKHPIMSREIMQNQFANLAVIPVDPASLDDFELSDAARFQDGTLVAAVGSPDIFVISEGLRRHIGDEITFREYGWSFNQVVWTNERSVLLHPLGEALTTELAVGLLEVASN